MIEVQNLSKRYGALVAVDELTFQVGRGEVVGFLGPNGAGKTTTLRILAGFLGATSGVVRIAGHDVSEHPLEARRCIGYLPEACPLYGEMRVKEYLMFRAELKRVPRASRASAVQRAAELALIWDYRDVLIAHLSKGLRQRVGVADALLGSPPLLILDEPTSGLDPNQIREMRALVRQLATEHTIVVSTHVLSEVESTCDRAIVLDRGRVVAQGSIEDLRAGQRARGVTVNVHGPALAAQLGLNAPLITALGTLLGSGSVRFVEGESPAHGVLHVRFAPEASAGEQVEAVVAELVHAGVGVREVRLEGADLEDVFARLTRAAASPAAEAS